MVAAYFAIHMLLPLLAFVWIMWRTPYGHGDFALHFLGTAGLAAFLFYWGQYAFVGSYYLRYALPLALAAVLVRHYVRSKKAEFTWAVPARWRQWSVTGLLSILAAVFGLIGMTAFRGTWRPDGPMVAMDMPLKQGKYYVSVGGSNGLLNMHYNNPDRSGQYAVDFNRLGSLGAVATRLFSASNQDHHIYADTVFSPCVGTVVETYDELPDRQVTLDLRNIPRSGNLITINCNELHVSLVHVRQHSIAVATGDTVVVGQALALVGNNGYSTEPHLHMQVSRRPDGGEDGRIGVPMLIGGRFLVRNDVVASGK